MYVDGRLNDFLIYLVNRYPVETQKPKPIPKKYENLSYMQRELCSKEFLKVSMRRGLNEEELKMMDERKMKDIKEEALKNYIVPKNIGNKTWKKTWIKALISTKKWSFNTFMVGIKSNKNHILNGQIDVLLIIQDFM